MAFILIWDRKYWQHQTVIMYEVFKMNISFSPMKIIAFSFLTLTLFFTQAIYAKDACERCEKITPSEVEKLFTRWNDSLKSKNIDSILSNYAEDAVLLPTLSTSPRKNQADIKKYFVDFVKNGPSGKIQERTIRIGCNWAMDTGLYLFSFSDGKEVQARYTYVYEYVNGKWLIVNHHSSMSPEIFI